MPRPGLQRITRSYFTILSVITILWFVTGTKAQAQTYQTLINFSGGQQGHSAGGLDGAFPYAPVTIDSAGNLYGTTALGGVGYGIVFKYVTASVGEAEVLYSFTGGNEGAYPWYGVAVGPDGNLYGATASGGQRGQLCGSGCGVVFQLKPQESSGSQSCPWVETVLYSFKGGSDGAFSIGSAKLLFGQEGNIYGTTSGGGSYNAGTVYKLSHSNSGWTENVLHTFASTPDGAVPYAGVVMDNAGNLYGTTSQGGACGYGIVYQLVPSDSGWTENILFNFSNGNEGGSPNAGVIVDSSGKLYGATSTGGLYNGGTVFELAPSGGTWRLNTLYAFNPDWNGGGLGPLASLTMDQAGNLYGASYGGGNAYGDGFKLTPSGGGWTYTHLHTFDNFEYPAGGVTLDANGNLYGTTQYGGSIGYGTVFQITP